MIVNCEQCKEPFERNTPKQKFCSNACRQRHFFHKRNETSRLKTIELEEENGALQKQINELAFLKQENERLKVTIRQKDVELAQLADLNDQHNLELERNNNHQAPLQVTTVKHNGPSINQIKAISGATRRLMGKQFNNMTPDQIDEVIAYLIELKASKPRMID
jgi:endogenous inhibitor of DNA gyrase (YacG/DUF329 family)